MFEIFIRTLVPPVLTCTIRRRVWFRKLLTCPGSGGCGAVAHVPIHCLALGFCAIASMDRSPMRKQAMVFATSLFIEMSCCKNILDGRSHVHGEHRVRNPGTKSRGQYER